MAQAGDQQQFCLRWNDFQTNMVSSFKHLRDEKSFTDVTLGKVSILQHKFKYNTNVITRTFWNSLPHYTIINTENKMLLMFLVNYEKIFPF